MVSTVVKSECVPIASPQCFTTEVKSDWELFLTTLSMKAWTMFRWQLVTNSAVLSPSMATDRTPSRESNLATSSAIAWTSGAGCAASLYDVVDMMFALMLSGSFLKISWRRLGTLRTMVWGSLLKVSKQLRSSSSCTLLMYNCSDISADSDSPITEATFEALAANRVSKFSKSLALYFFDQSVSAVQLLATSSRRARPSLTMACDPHPLIRFVFAADG
eukprot:1753554-Pyramimonas_sp.AAC.2